MNRIYKFPQDIQKNYFLMLYCFLFYVVDRMKSPCSVKHRSIADVLIIYTVSCCKGRGERTDTRALRAWPSSEDCSL